MVFIQAIANKYISYNYYQGIYASYVKCMNKTRCMEEINS